MFHGLLPLSNSHITRICKSSLVRGQVQERERNLAPVELGFGVWDWYCWLGLEFWA